jgi:hypothetical protein
MSLNKDPESWAKVDARAVTSGSSAQSENVLRMALQDIARLNKRLEAVRADRDRIARNREMWKAQCAQQAALLHEEKR